MSSRLRLSAIAAVAAALLLAVTALAAQPRVMIGARPAPNQTARLRMAQSLDFTLKPTGTDPSPVLPADGIAVVGSSTLVLRQDVGALDEQGRLRLDVTYEEVEQTMRLNGNPVPIPQEGIDGLRGKRVTIWMGQKREILDVVAPPGFPLPADQMQQMLGPLQASVPFQEMSVGELVTLPFSMAMPIPVPGSNGPTMLTGQTKTTLAKLTPEAGDQLALLDQSIDVGLGGTAASGSGVGPNVAIALKLSGTGATEIFVASGLLKSTRMTATMTGQFESAGTGARAMKVAGTFTLDVTRMP